MFYLSYTTFCIYICVFFFFFKQKTAYEIRPCDWSSDVCSSDLRVPSSALGDWPGRRWRGTTRSEERRVGKEVRSCVDLGGRRIIKKKKKKTKNQTNIKINDNKKIKNTKIY